MNRAQILEGLTREQHAAVTMPAGDSALVRAGAGTGKTRVLTARIAWLWCEGFALERVVAVTFTRKAAREMRERIRAVVGENEMMPSIGTYHALAGRMVRRHAEAASQLECAVERRFTQRFTILDESDQINAIKETARGLIGELTREDEARARENNEPVPAPRRLATKVAVTLVKALDQEARNETDPGKLLTQVDARGVTVTLCRPGELDPVDLPAGDLIRGYGTYKSANDTLDYRDLIQIACQLCEQRPDLVSPYVAVLADEYQDTDLIQERWLQAVCRAAGATLFAVGDASQLIYAWRGAQVRQILSLPKRIGCREYALSVNFRSPPHVLDVANQALAAAKLKTQRERLRAANADREPSAHRVLLHSFADAHDEADWIAHSIARALDAGRVKPDDIAVLARMRGVWTLLEAMLTRRRIPYQVVAGRALAQRKEIRHVASWLRIAINPADNLACEHILVDRGTGFGPVSMQRALECARLWGRPVSESLEELAEAKIIKGRAAQTAHEVADELHALGYALDRGDPPSAFLDRVLDASGVLVAIERQVADPDPDEVTAGRAKRERIEELRAIAGDCANVLDLHEHLSVSDLPPQDGEDIARVTLSTIHQAKGLEWPNVIVMALEEDVLPSAGPEEGESADSGGIEEERRILHVACTRAQHTLTLTASRKRRGIETGPSAFAAELGDAITQRTHERRIGAADPQPTPGDDATPRGGAHPSHAT